MREDKSGAEIDPICGMTVNALSAAENFKHAGKTYYFCSAGCLQKFVAQSQGIPASGFVGIGRAKKETVRHCEMNATPRGEFTDPVCGMSVVPETAAGKYEHKGETFYFCSTGCLNKFKQNAASFLEMKKEEKQTPASEAVEYTCPMHPEILQIGSGSCPKCGMALEPKVFTLTDAPDPEYSDMAVLDFSRVDDSGFRAEQNVESARVENFESVTGKGIVGSVNGVKILLGNVKLMTENDVDFPANGKADEFRAEGQTVMFVAAGGEPAGLVGVADTIKESAKAAIDDLRRRKIEVVMMTGDNAKTAAAVAKKLGIDKVFADVLPDEKAAKIKGLQAQGKIVAMAGDGVNDAPALAQADVGIAMGTGTDAAMESADITLLKGDLRGILRARELSRATMKNIRQNLFFAFVYNLIGVPVAAGVLYPIFGLLLSPMIASAAMTFSSVSVIANAPRLRNLKL